LTFEGFKRYCWDIEIGCIEQYFVNQDKLYDEYISICSRIKNSIRENQITGGIIGVFNPSITQRLNNISDNVDMTSGGDKIGLPAIVGMVIKNEITPPDEPEQDNSDLF